MKNLKYIAVSCFALAALAACTDDETLQTTDIGPQMTVVAADANGVFGGKVNFEVTLKDRLPLSTLKAQIYFDDEMVAEEVIRTKENGTYAGAVSVPFHKEIADGQATLRLVGQNIRFGLTSIDQPLAVKRPDLPYLTYVMGGKEYKMERIDLYQYAVTADFPQKPKGYIVTPALDAAGTVVNFGYDAEQGVVTGSTEPIPFSNSNAGNYTISFNIKTFEASPFVKLLFNGAEMTMQDDNNYYFVTTLTQNAVYEMTGISGFEQWNVDCDYFERPDVANAAKLKFLPMTGMYKITANFAFEYLKIEAMKSATELATLNDDGSGALWAIGDKSVGKPKMANGATWDPENGGLCLARVGKTKYQLTLVAGLSLNAAKFDFKFFHQKTWGGEFGAGTITTTSDLVAINSSGNLGLAADKKFVLGGIYRFTVDVPSKTAAVLTVEKIGDQQLPPADLTVNGSKMTMVDADNYTLDLPLTQGAALTLGGADAFVPAWINPDFFTLSASGVTLAPLTGHYRIVVNITTKTIDALALNADGSALATLNDAGHGALYFIGYGIGSPAAKDEPGWTTEKGVCVPEFAQGIFKMTAQAGKEGSIVLGQRFRVSGWDGKFFAERGWGGIGTPTLAPGTEALLTITGGGNINLATGVTLSEKATYEMTVDCTAGKANPVITFVKK